MQFKTFVNAVALALLAAGVHAKVPGGTYSIVNKVLSSDDLQRATTFNGFNQMVTVSSYDPIASKQVYSASINHLVCLFLIHPLAVDCGRRRRPRYANDFSRRR